MPIVDMLTKSTAPPFARLTCPQHFDARWSRFNRIVIRPGSLARKVTVFARSVPLSGRFPYKD